jgi:hypothetical protein
MGNANHTDPPSEVTDLLVIHQFLKEEKIKEILK